MPGVDHQVYDDVTPASLQAFVKDLGTSSQDGQISAKDAILKLYLHGPPDLPSQQRLQMLADAEERDLKDNAFRCPHPILTGETIEWTSHMDNKTELAYYYNVDEERSQWEHPCTDSMVIKPLIRSRINSSIKRPKRTRLTHRLFYFEGVLDGLESVKALLGAGEIAQNLTPEALARTCAPYGGCPALKHTIAQLFILLGPGVLQPRPHFLELRLRSVANLH